MMSNKITGNEPAMPTGQNQSGTGLTIRQHFAAMAMQAILSNEELRIKLLVDTKIGGTDYLDYISFFAVKNADYLIKELNK